MKPAFEKQLHELLLGPGYGRVPYPTTVQQKRRRLSNLLQKASRVTSRTPEVLVRITGKAKGLRNVEAHLRYLTRNGVLIAEDESRQEIIGARMIKDLAHAWMESADVNRRKNSRDTVNIVLSMKAGTDANSLHSAARAFAQSTFADQFAYVLVRHDDTSHVHCHLTVRSLGFAGTRLNPRRSDLQLWREGFAAACREFGIPAEATPRRCRNVERNHVVREQWTDAAYQLKKVNSQNADALAAQIEQFVNENRGVTYGARPPEKSLGSDFNRKFSPTLEVSR